MGVDRPCFAAYSSRFRFTFSIHTASAVGSITVTITTGAPVPISDAALLPPPPSPPNSHIMVRIARIPRTMVRSLSLRSRFLSAGGIGMEVWFRAAYGGGRDVFRGGRAKCMVEARRA